MVSHCSSVCTTEQRASRLPCHSISGRILPAGCRLMINFLFYCPLMHQVRSISEQFYPPKMDIWTEKARTIWYSSTCFVPGNFMLLCRKMSTKTKDRGARAELGCSWTVPLDCLLTAVSTTAASLDTYFRSSWSRYSGEQQRDEMVIAIGMIPQPHPGEKAQ